MCIASEAAIRPILQHENRSRRIQESCSEFLPGDLPKGKRDSLLRSEVTQDRLLVDAGSIRDVLRLSMSLRVSFLFRSRRRACLSAAKVPTSNSVRAFLPFEIHLDARPGIAPPRPPETTPTDSSAESGRQLDFRINLILSCG